MFCFQSNKTLILQRLFIIFHINLLIEKLFNRFYDRFPNLNKLEKNSHNFILVIVDFITKMVYYKPIQVTINITNLVEIIIDIIINNFSLLDFIMSNKKLMLTSKFQGLLYYFLDIMQKLPTAFYIQTNGQKKKQNSIIEIYLQAFCQLETDQLGQILAHSQFYL